MSVQKSRPRPSNTCDQCKRRKLKCDQKRPACGRCVATPGLQCSYRHTLLPPYSDRPCPEPPLESLAASSDKNIVPADLASGSTISLPNDRIEHLEERLNHLSDLVQSLRNSRESIPNSETGHYIEGQSNFPEGHSTALEATRADPADPGFLAAQPSSRARYVSRAFWARLCEENGVIEELLREQTRYDTIPPKQPQEDPKALSGTILSNVPAWDTEPTQSARFRPASCILNNVPSRPICDHLLQAYVWNFHPVIPIVHIPTLFEEYNRFWETQDHADPHLSTAMPGIPLIIAVLFAGAVVCASRDVFDSQTQKSWAVSLHRTASETLRLSSFPRTPTIESLTAYIIVQGTFMREEEPLATCSFIGVAVRVAQMLGLHKDAMHFASNTPKQITAEIRRRVWWHIFALDVLVATAAGLPPLIDHDSFNVALPSDVLEYLWDKPQAQPYMGLSNSAESDTDLNGPASAAGIFIRCRVRLRISQRKILDTLNVQSISDANAVKEMESELETVRNFLELHIDRMLRLPAIPESYETNRTYVLWASLLLATMNDKNWSLLHQLLGRRGMTDPTLRPLSLSIKSHAFSFLSKYIILSCVDRFASFQWCWPGNHQPLHALIIMLKYLDHDPIATDAVTIRNLIDETIALCDADGGVNRSIDGVADIRRRPLTEGGREAWDLIRKLRAGIFVKIELDPDILPTRDQVVDSARRRLENMEVSPNTLLKGGAPILHDTLFTVANDNLGCSPFPTAADYGVRELMGGFVSSTPSLSLDLNDWDALFSV